MMLDNSVILAHKQTSDMPRHKQKVVIKTVEVKWTKWDTHIYSLKLSSDNIKKS